MTKELINTNLQVIAAVANAIASVLGAGAVVSCM